MAARTFLGTLRLAILLAVLLFVALGAWLDRARSRDWNDTLRVTVYPISDSADAGVRAYTAALQAEDFADVESFFVDEACGLRHHARATRADPCLARRAGVAAGVAGSARAAHDCALEPAPPLLRCPDCLERSFARTRHPGFRPLFAARTGFRGDAGFGGSQQGTHRVDAPVWRRGCRRQQPGGPGPRGVAHARRHRQI